MKFEVKWKRAKKERIFLIVLSIVFAMFWVWGNYETLGFSGGSLFFICTVRVIVYSIIFYMLLGIIWDKVLVSELMNTAKARTKSKNYIGACLGFVCYVGYLIFWHCIQE